MPRKPSARASTVGAHAPAVAASAAPFHGKQQDEQTAEATAEVMALTECLIGGTRRRPREWFTVPAASVARLVECGLVLSQPMLFAMAPAARAAWDSVAQRVERDQQAGLLPSALVVDRDTVDRLWAGAGRILTPDAVTPYATTYAAAAPQREAIRVLQVTEYDPGSSVYRYHSAANTVPGIVSALVRYDYTNPHCHLRQWDGEAHLATVEALAATADVIHCHMDYRGIFQRLRTMVERPQRVAITYHGSMTPGDPRRTFVDPDADARFESIRFGARPYHARWGVEHWLPIPMPCADYAAMAAALRVPRAQRNGQKYRVAHSPTKRSIKGTDAFLSAITRLREQRGLAIEAVLIEEMDHGEALALKATCDAVFDSFWLGMQGSGLEGAAMGCAVVAGDAAAREDYARLGLDAPWTVADDEMALTNVLERLATDSAYHAAEAARVGAYVRTYHDYPVVGARYRDILTEALRGAANDR